jgi:hypothetical protein
MFTMLIDTSVWLDLARDPKQHAVLGVVEQMIVNTGLNLTHFSHCHRSKSDPPWAPLASNGCRFLCCLTGLSFIFESIAVTGDLHDVRVV